LRRFISLGFLVAIIVAAGGCREALRPPFERAFSLQIHSPRILLAGQETTVPLVAVNTGTRTWDPANVHVSYHWLWLVPRELASRSRNVPYEDGIRTELDAPIAAGGRLETSGRLLAPSFPGLYWIQWDMVEEGVTWFSQVSPRKGRTLVVIMPTPFAVFAPLPLLFALAGIYAVGRIERRRQVAPELLHFALGADALWAAAALFGKPLVLVSEALLEPTPVAYWLMAAVAVVPVLALSLIFSRRSRGWPLFALGVVAAVLVGADSIYYRFFGDVLSVPALFAVGQTPRVVATIRSLFTARLVWLFIDLPFAARLIVRLRGTWVFDRQPQRRPWRLALGAAAAFGAAGFALSAPAALQALPLDQMFRNRTVMEQLGPYGFHAYDAWMYVRATTLRPPLTKKEIEALASWFADRAPLRAGAGSAYFGAAARKNLIVVQVESLQDFVVDYRVGAQEVMPHLRQWRGDSWRFTNVTDQTNEGRTSDAEFTTMVSLLPLDHGAVSFRYPENAYVGLPRVLAQHGYSTMSAVAFEPGFWNRSVMHPLYGFSRSYYESDFTMTEQIGWGLNDHDFLQQMVPRLESQRQPFCAWLITLSLHHPFDSFPDKHKTLRLGTLEGTSFGNYLHTMHFFDQALEDFRTSLAQAGLLDDSVLVVFGDHDAGFARDAALSRTIGIGADEASWMMNDRVPLFVRVPRLWRDHPDASHEMAMPAGQTDLAPTLLGLLGIDAASLPYMGRNLLGDPQDPPVVRPFGNWLDRAHLMVHGASRTGCYVVATRKFDADPVACRSGNMDAQEARDVSKLVITEDLQQQLRGRLMELVQ
jgi:phosphoglycerol transferase MdoB-like AlkP superfamily enzyme